MGLKKFQNQIQVVIFRRKASARLSVLQSLFCPFGILAIFWGGGGRDYQNVRKEGWRVVRRDGSD